MSAVRCIGVSRIFRQGEHAVTGLDNVSLEIGKGQFVCLVAPSGGGKTTLLNAIGGLDRPDAGEIWVEGQRIDILSKGALAEMRLRHIGFVFQAYNLIPVLTARENVEFVMQLQGVAAGERRRRADAILAEVGLEGLEDRRPAKMSGGQQQRVAVARAIVSEPAMVLADEPTANLDSHAAEQLMELFVSLNKKHHTTFIIATHDPRVMSYAGRIVRLLDGRIVEDSVQAAA
jgi:putative ABC transport system ATP-binding protein